MPDFQSIDAADKPVVIVADNDHHLLEMMEYHLSSWGFCVHCAEDLAQLRKRVADVSADLVLLDIDFGEHCGLAVLGELLSRQMCPPIVVLTADGSIDNAVEAIRLGAHDYLLKPANLNRLRMVASYAIQKHRIRKRMGESGFATAAEETNGILGTSQAIIRIRELISDVAVTNAKVLILGESGTGKELVARAIHAQSPRADKVFAPVNMAALPPTLAESVLFGHEKGAFTGADSVQKGWCEMADQGTLFLDEIGEMDLALQAKLLRFLQDSTITRVGSNKVQTVDVRIVAATNRDPAVLVREGRLREDLYYRLNVLPVVIPPLRDRREDILLLAHVFLERAAKNYHKAVSGFTDGALQIITGYDWPGNVRQLENCIERLVILSRGSTIGPDELPPEILAMLNLAPAEAAGDAASEPSAQAPAEAPESRYVMRHIEKEAILEALSKTQWNVVRAARVLGLGQATVYRKMKRYGINLKRVGQNGKPVVEPFPPKTVAS